MVPTFDVVDRYAASSRSISGVRGLDEHAIGRANQAFVLVHRLDPRASARSRARYTQEVVAAFDRARAAKPAMVPLAIKGTGRVWIDGVERGPAPGTFEVESGEHLDPGHRRRARDARQVDRSGLAVPTSIEIEKTRPRADDRQVRRARLVFSRAGQGGRRRGPRGRDEAARGILGVADAVMISKRARRHAPEWVTWQDRAPGFSAPQAYTHQEPIDLIEPLAAAEAARAAAAHQKSCSRFIRPSRSSIESLVPAARG